MHVGVRVDWCQLLLLWRLLHLTYPQLLLLQIREKGVGLIWGISSWFVFSASLLEGLLGNDEDLERCVVSGGETSS